MNKKLMILLSAALLLVAFTACNNGSGDDTTNNPGIIDPEDSYIVIGTDENGNDVTVVDPGTSENPGFDPSEPNATFTDVTKKVIVIARVATVRTDTVVADNNGIGWPSEGRVLDVTGESENWYRIDYVVNGDTTTCYIAKNVAADVTALDGFTAVEEEVEITEAAVNVRSYPSTASDFSIRFTLKKGEKVTRIGVSEKWSRVRVEVKSETETTADGEAVVEIKEYYVSNDCLKVVSTATEAGTEAATEPTTDAATN
jgi:SH3-like domain-containing protein